MIKNIRKLGNSQGIVIDAALMELAHLKVGDALNVEVHAGGTLTLTPIRPQPSPAQLSEVIQTTMQDYARTMQKLA